VLVSHPAAFHPCPPLHLPVLPLMLWGSEAGVVQIFARSQERNTVHWPPGAGSLHIYSGVADNMESKEEKQPDKIKVCYQV